VITYRYRNVIHAFTRELSPLGTFDLLPPIFLGLLFQHICATVLISMTRQEFQELIYESPQTATVLLDLLISIGLATRQSEYTNGRRRDVYLLTEVVR
jgi:hypothetical protein